MAHGRDRKYETRIKPDDRFVTRGELRVDLEKHAEITVKIIRDSMSEVAGLLYLVLGKDKVDAAIAQAMKAQEIAEENRDAMIEHAAHSIAEDMARADSEKAARDKLKLQ